MAARASADCGWSTSSSRVLSDWTISGPSVTFLQAVGRLSIVANNRAGCAVPGRSSGQAVQDVGVAVLVDPVADVAEPGRLDDPARGQIVRMDGRVHRVDAAFVQGVARQGGHDLAGQAL